MSRRHSLSTWCASVESGKQYHNTVTTWRQHLTWRQQSCHTNAARPVVEIKGVKLLRCVYPHSPFRGPAGLAGYDSGTATATSRNDAARAAAAASAPCAAPNALPMLGPIVNLQHHAEIQRRAPISHANKAVQ